MKKLSIFLFLIACHYSELLAQDVSLGIKAGVNLSEWRGKIPESTRLLTGFHFGPTISLRASDNIFIVPSLLLSQKGNMSHRIFDEVHGTESLFSDLKKEYKFTYLDLPVYVKFKVVSGLSIYAGPQFSYLLKATSKSEEFFRINEGEEHFQELEIDDLKGYNKFDLAVVVGLDYLFSNGINLNAGYDFGLSQLKEVAYDSKVHNRVIKLSVGYYF